MAGFNTWGKRWSLGLTVLSLLAVAGIGALRGQEHTKTGPPIKQGEPEADTTSDSAEDKPEIEVRRSKVKTESWTMPEPGWLYVLDTWSGDPQILLLDPDTESIRGVIKTGARPDMALSPDGIFLYVVSGKPKWLSVIDTQKGNIVHEEVCSDCPNIPITWGSRMVISEDGTRLYLHKMRMVSPGTYHYIISIFDTDQRRFLPQETVMPECGGFALFAGPREKELFVHCSKSNDLRVLRFASDGQVSSMTKVSLPWTRPQGRHTRWWFAGWQEVEGAPHVLRGDGTVFEFIPWKGNGSFREQNSFLPEDRQIYFRKWPSSSDGTRVYIGSSYVMQGSSQSTAQQIYVVDTRSWQEIANIKTSQQFWLLATDPEDRYIYASGTFGRTFNSDIVVIDAVSLKEVKVIQDVGKRPMYILVAP